MPVDKAPTLSEGRESYELATLYTIARAARDACDVRVWLGVDAYRGEVSSEMRLAIKLDRFLSRPHSKPTGTAGTKLYWLLLAALGAVNRRESLGHGLYRCDVAAEKRFARKLEEVRVLLDSIDVERARLDAGVDGSEG
jgi:hypothetical protein